MALLRLCALFACLACAAGFAPAAAPRAVCQQRASPVVMVTAATKPQRVNKRNYEYNKQYRSEMRTRIKRVRGRPAEYTSTAAVAARAARRPLQACSPTRPSLFFSLCAGARGG